MLAARTLIRASRSTVPRVGAIRSYTESVGRGTQSKGFADKEKAQEDYYIYEKEKETLKKLKAEAESHKSKIDELEKSIKDKESKQK